MDILKAAVSEYSFMRQMRHEGSAWQLTLGASALVFVHTAHALNLEALPTTVEGPCLKELVGCGEGAHTPERPLPPHHAKYSVERRASRKRTKPHQGVADVPGTTHNGMCTVRRPMIYVYDQPALMHITK